MISVFEILTHLCCEPALEGLRIAYINDPNVNTNVVLYVSEAVTSNRKITTSVNLRSAKGKGASATRIAKELVAIKDKVYRLEREDGSFSNVTVRFSDFIADGVDDKERMNMSAQVTIKI